MIRIITWIFSSHIALYENKCKFIQKGMAVQLPLITGRNVKDLAPENVYLVLF